MTGGYGCLMFCLNEELRRWKCLSMTGVAIVIEGRDFLPGYHHDFVDN